MVQGFIHNHLVFSVFPDDVAVSMPHPERRQRFLVFKGGGMGEPAHRRGRRGQGSRGTAETLAPRSLEKKI